MPSRNIYHLNHRDLLTYEEVYRIARCAVEMGVNKIRITGGEPLVRKDLPTLISLLSSIKGIEDLSLTTNGILLSDMAQSLKESGLMRVNISLDTLKARKYKTITHGGDIKRVLRGIQAARKWNLVPLKINVVIIRGINDDEIIDFAKLTIDNEYHLRFIEYMPIGRDNMWDISKFVSSEELKENIKSACGDLFAVHGIDGGGPAKYFKLSGAKGSIGFIGAISDHFCSSCNRLRLTSDGRIRGCLFSDTEVNAREAIRQGCPDEEIKTLLFKAISIKPAEHYLEERAYRGTQRTMSEVGG